MRTGVVALAALLCLGIRAGLAQIPSTISYQGVLTDSLDRPRHLQRYGQARELNPPLRRFCPLESDVKQLAQPR